jgi:putative FmdB family regulatory protein
MPLYEYLCEACGQQFELIQKFSDPAPDACPKCGKGPVERQLSSPAIQFKGSGWYITDYARKGASSGEAGAKSSSESSASTDSGGESKKTETKTETKKTESTPTSPAASSTSSDKP